MYPGYLGDRKALNYTCEADHNSTKFLSILRKYGITKILIPACIILNSAKASETGTALNNNTRPPLIRLLSNQDNVDMRGGADKFKKDERLLRSILSKMENSPIDDISINKQLQRLFNLENLVNGIGSIITNQDLLKFLAEFEKPLKFSKLVTTLPGQLPNYRVNAFSPPATDTLSPMQQRFAIRMAQQNGNLQPFHRNGNFPAVQPNDNFPAVQPNGNFEPFHQFDESTRLRRVPPQYPSQVLGEQYQYGDVQLERKEKTHINDFTDGLTVIPKNQTRAENFRLAIEQFLRQPNLIINAEATLNNQEPVIVFMDKETKKVVIFGNRREYEKHDFISAYAVSDDALKTFLKTNNLGLTREQRMKDLESIKIRAQQAKDATQRAKQVQKELFDFLPKTARMGNHQLREGQAILDQRAANPDFAIPAEKASLINRMTEYQQQKELFDFLPATARIKNDQLQEGLAILKQKDTNPTFEIPAEKADLINSVIEYQEYRAKFENSKNQNDKKE